MSSSVERPVARDRHAMTVAAIWIVVPQGLVLHAPIVPERNTIGLPPKTNLPVRASAMFVQEFQDRFKIEALDTGECLSLGVAPA